MFNIQIFVITVFCLFLIKCDDPRNRESKDDVSSKVMAAPNDFLLKPEHGHRSHHLRYHPGHYAGHEEFRPHLYTSTDHRDEDLDEEDYSPISAGGPYTKEDHTNSSLQIPLEFIQNINKYSVNDLLLNYVEGDDEPFVVNRFADEDGARNAATIPKAAGCIPELKTITVATSDDPSILYIPQCTRVERCGGCCSHSLLSCQPKETETLTYQVMKTQYTGGKKLKFIGKEVVVVEKHVSCKCDCKVKEEVLTAHCNKYQEYRASECRCACTNIDEEKKCNKNGLKKLWNPELCACQCREVLQCSTGYAFDQIECRCMAIPMRRRYANDDRKGYALSVSPLFDDY